MDRTSIIQIPVLNFRDFIAVDGELLTTTSIKVAAVFGKDHAKVLLRIRALIADLGGEHQSYFGLMFAVTNIGQGASRKDPVYLVTRDGFALLVMGFTGKKALVFKVAYIKAFNAMAAYIKNQREGLQYQFLKKEIAYTTRKKGVSASARDMRNWQKDKPVMVGEMNVLLDKLQPSLLTITE